MGILDFFRKNKEPIDTNKSVIKVNIEPFLELINDDPNDWYTKAADSLMNSTYSIIKNT